MKLKTTIVPKSVPRRNGMCIENTSIMCCADYPKGTPCKSCKNNSIKPQIRIEIPHGSAMVDEDCPKEVIEALYRLAELAYQTTINKSFCKCTSETVIDYGGRCTRCGLTVKLL